jgi:hypothetical protein
MSSCLLTSSVRPVTAAEDRAWCWALSMSDDGIYPSAYLSQHGFESLGKLCYVSETVREAEGRLYLTLRELHTLLSNLLKNVLHP